MGMDGWKKELKNYAKYITDKIEVEKLSIKNYISTENMLPNFAGITVANNLPKEKKVNKFEQGDVLISNIRPYFKKVWKAEFSGGASNDVLIIRRISDKINLEYFYYILANDSFIDYVVSTSKGTKMPRGDKKAIMKYLVCCPKLEFQKKVAKILTDLDEKIKLNNEINNNLLF